MGYDDAIERIDKGIKTLRIDFERFFSGAVPIPPEDLRTRLAQEFRQLRNSNISAGDSFRLGTLEARFNTYNELFNRRLREREEGRAVPHTEPPAQRSRHDAEAGISLGDAADNEAIEALFVGMYRKSGNTQVDLDSFRNYLGSQIHAIRQKTGCEQVQFRIAIEDGKPRLKAKPIGRAQVPSGPR